jgi:hypothetical protein
MWRTALLSWLRQVSFSKGGAVSDCLIRDAREKEHFGPMSDQQLAVAIRQVRNDALLQSTEHLVRKGQDKMIEGRNEQTA